MRNLMDRSLDLINNYERYSNKHIINEATDIIILLKNDNNISSVNKKIIFGKIKNIFNELRLFSDLEIINDIYNLKVPNVGISDPDVYLLYFNIYSRIFESYERTEKYLQADFGSINYKITYINYRINYNVKNLLYEIHLNFNIEYNEWGFYVRYEKIELIESLVKRAEKKANIDELIELVLSIVTKNMQ